MISNIEKNLNKDNYIVYKCKGQSMLPLIRQNKDVVVVKKAQSKCKKRDIVLYKVKSKYILHRVVCVGKNFYITKGDNCLRKDYKISRENILGVVESLERNGKTIAMDSKLMKLYGWICADLYFIWNGVIFCKKAFCKIVRMCKSIIKKNES